MSTPITAGKKGEGQWLRTDEYQEVVATLHACHEFLAHVPQDLTYWKWVFIALHNLVQGCMVVALTRSDGFGAIKAEQERKWLEAYHSNTPLPKQHEKLLPFLELYKKIQEESTIQYSSAVRFVPNESQSASMEKLNSIRNEFIHFTPKGWSLELSGAPKVAMDCLEVAEFLTKHSSRFMLFSSFKEGELESLISSIKRDLQSMT